MGNLILHPGRFRRRPKISDDRLGAPKNFLRPKALEDFIQDWTAQTIFFNQNEQIFSIQNFS